MMAEELVQKIVTVSNLRGLHARPAAELSKLASCFRAEVTLEREDHQEAPADCRSIMGLLMMAAGKDTRLHLCAAGPDAAEAVRRISEYFESGFGETD